MLAIYILLGLSFFIIFHAMIGYPIFIKVLKVLVSPPELPKDKEYLPRVSYMITAHNEEQVIYEKLKNTIEIDYPIDLLEIIVASDNSTDATNDIVQEFINQNKLYDIRLYCVKERKGKTNAQNEAQKTATGEILVMTDANSMVRKNAIRELVSSFASEDIVYVCGRQLYSNENSSDISNSESMYGNYDVFMKDVESRMQCITGGEGSLYACRNSEYIDFNPIMCHDSAMPYAYALAGKRAVFNPKAIAVEKAGEIIEDEFARKVRMNRYILTILKNSVKTLNVFKYRWFSVFYFGHRTCRYSLWVAHIVLLITSCIWGSTGSMYGMLIFGGQIVAFLLAFIGIKAKISFVPIRLLGYYLMTVYAQLMGVINIISGRAKPFWESVESTR